MKRIGILSASKEGHTARIAYYLADALRVRGLAVDVRDVRYHASAIELWAAAESANRRVAPGVPPPSSAAGASRAGSGRYRLKRSSNTSGTSSGPLNRKRQTPFPSAVPMCV